nr:protein EFR3 homolog cmp44E isoform X1 [Helicoverpa armigera]
MSFVKCCFEAGEGHDFLDSFVQKCTDPGCCCGCCSALRPRYKRLVDNIFPAIPQDGLVKTNMEKLTFYSLSSPEKLDRIGEYLFQKASRDIYRRRHGFVIIAMEAMDQLLVACHSQTLNLFVESFLKMVQKLLESTDPQLQILATQSFVRFANIEEDTPSYHRRYDFFVSKFSAMCHSNHIDKVQRDNIRLAGIQGLQGVIRKTVSDDLVENIWEAQHMDKIVPSLLYNMQTAEKYDTVLCMEGGAGEEEPARLAEACLRELVGRASFGHIRSVLRPVLTHFDRHELWIPNDFAVHTFKIIMFSIQAQYSYSVVEALMQHLDAGGSGASERDYTRVRAARAAVLSNIVAIAAGDSVGPSVLEIINNLLTNLRASVARDSEKETDEKLYQEALINALGEFADHLPDFQKIDIMMFIVNKVPSSQRANKGTKADCMLQSILLKSLLKVGTTYRTGELSKAFPAAFLDALLRVAAAAEPRARALLQRILHTLLDRRGNAPRLHHATVDVCELGLIVEKCSRQDLIFISKHGYALFSSLYEGLQLESNMMENVEAIYTTLALICIELGSEETVGDIMQLVLAIQQSSLSNPVLSVAQQCQLQAISISLAALVPHVLLLPRLADYIHKIIVARREEAPHLLPPLREEYDDLPPAKMPNKLPYLMMDQMALCDMLKAHGVDVSRLSAASPYSAGNVALPHRHSWLEAGAAQGRDSLAEITAPGTELDSANSSPGVQRLVMLNDVPPQSGGSQSGVSLEALRRAAGGPSGAERRDAERRRATLNNAFRTAPFDQLLHITQPKYEIKDKLEEIFNSISEEPLLPQSGPCSPAGKSYQHQVPPYTKYFPELFLY